MDNVFIGSNSVILGGVRIGPNAIIASGAVVTRDVPPDSVVAGVPAKRICSFQEYVKKRTSEEEIESIARTTHNQHLTVPEIENAWSIFKYKHDQVSDAIE